MDKETEKALSKGELIDADALAASIDTIPDDDNFVDNLALLFTRIAVQKPLITKVAQIGPSALRSYLIKNGMQHGHNGQTLFNLIAMFDKNEINRQLILLYEKNYGITRELLHYLNDLDGENKIPYAYRFLGNIYSLRYKRPFSVAALTEMMNDRSIISFIQELEKTTALKKYAGETNTSCKAYDWILDDCPIFKDVIERADCAIDLGGGYATPYLSDIFECPLVSYDLISPKSCQELGVHLILPTYITRKEYHQRLDEQPWQPFDVFIDRFPTDKNTYFITSFGFATSTVRSIGEKSSTNNWLQLTYECFRRVAELVALDKEVYFFFYGRPTIRVHRNKIMAFHIRNKKLQRYYLYSDPFSMNTERIVGVNYIMARKNLGIELDAE